MELLENYIIQLNNINFANVTKKAKYNKLSFGTINQNFLSRDSLRNCQQFTFVISITEFKNLLMQNDL